MTETDRRCKTCALCKLETAVNREPWYYECHAKIDAPITPTAGGQRSLILEAIEKSMRAPFNWTTPLHVNGAGPGEEDLAHIGGKAGINCPLWVPITPSGGEGAA